MSDAIDVRPIPRIENPFAARLTLPGSKSIALRHLVMSTLADEPTRLFGVPRCEDVDAMFDAVQRLGTSVEREGRSAMLTPPAEPLESDVDLDLGMSGVSLRLLLAHAALRTSTTRFTGHRQLHQRPNADLIEALKTIGCKIESNEGRLPIRVAGPASPTARTTLATGVTSQYLSGLMLSAPALPSGLAIALQGARTSASYIGVTPTEMARRGVRVETPDGSTVVVPPGRYTGGDVLIEGDASAATYHAALATLHGGRITLTNLGNSTRQGDYAFLDLCERMGAEVSRTADQVTIKGPASPRPVGDADMVDMPDAAPTLMAMAPFLPAPTHITGLATLRVKECDRIACAAKELRKAGVPVEEFDAAMTIHPADALRPAGFETYEDHRMAMALSVMASKVGGCVIRGADCVAKTYADYWEDFDRVCRRDGSH
ncbi:MAG: 3-phosphoshikimate 1-carboxyvinyltransferase [Gammaproteobacteria bacterium]|nr:3-phosphoshikimate 1-carboxyvinyltransferase [Gammaproteobacteria bacterium]